ncbi:MAG: hypothetical protein WCO22_10565 [Betaproteobacteria bacterium]
MALLNDKVAYNQYELAGEFTGQILMAFLLWKKWKNKDGKINSDEVVNEKN